MAGYAQNTNLIAVRGDTIDFGMLSSNNNSSTITALKNGTAINLTGAGIRLTAKYATDDLDAAAVFTLTVGTGITVTNAAQGQLTAIAPPTATNSLPPFPTTLVWDLQVTEASGAITTFLYGTLVILPDISITTP